MQYIFNAKSQNNYLFDDFKVANFNIEFEGKFKIGIFATLNNSVKKIIAPLR